MDFVVPTSVAHNGPKSVVLRGLLYKIIQSKPNPNNRTWA